MRTLILIALVGLAGCSTRLPDCDTVPWRVLAYRGELNAEKNHPYWQGMMDTSKQAVEKQMQLVRDNQGNPEFMGVMVIPKTSCVSATNERPFIVSK